MTEKKMPQNPNGPQQQRPEDPKSAGQEKIPDLIAQVQQQRQYQQQQD